MNTEKYLQSLGWRKGEGLRPGSLRKPILLKHRKDNRGLGYNPQASDGWWERVFDGHLKTLDVNTSSSGVEISVDEEKRRRAVSPLYAMFRPGGVLAGTIPSSKSVAASEDSKQKRHKKSRKSKDVSNAGKKHSKGERTSGEHKKSKKHRKEKEIARDALGARENDSKVSKRKSKKKKREAVEDR